tara:strand:+ start:120 stop:365 length:246 start_codon:yes stop_codon:yes gene_type:complete
MSKKEKTDLERFNEFVDWFHELVWGTPREKEKDIGHYIGLDRPKRSRTKKGRYRGDDKSTENYNEAWVGGKSPKTKKRKKK